jgi:hypothetical protein
MQIPQIPCSCPYWPATVSRLVYLSQSQSQSCVTTDGQSASLSWYQAPSGAQDPICITIRQLGVCWCGAPPLTWGRVCRLQFCWPSPAHSRVKFPRDSWPYFSVSDSRVPQPGGPSPHIYIPQKQDGPVIPQGTGFPFRRLLRLAGLRWSIRTRLHTG